jgi:mannose-6-phosphate isomerase-like protein (cupin superfamily)
MSTIEKPAGQPYTLPKETGVTDVWWPFGPAPAVSRWSIKIAAEQTEGRLLQILSRDGRGMAPPMHIHHGADETWYVIEGELTIFVGDERIKAGPGDFVFGPMGVPHSFLVTSDWAEFLVTFSPAGFEGPAGSGVDGFFREVAVPVVPGKGPPEPSEADPEEFTRRMAQYGIEVVGPPPALDAHGH